MDFPVTRRAVEGVRAGGGRKPTSGRIRQGASWDMCIIGTLMVVATFTILGLMWHYAQLFKDASEIRSVEGPDGVVRFGRGLRSRVRIAGGGDKARSAYHAATHPHSTVVAGGVDNIPGTPHPVGPIESAPKYTREADADTSPHHQNGGDQYTQRMVAGMEMVRADVLDHARSVLDAQRASPDRERDDHAPAKPTYDATVQCSCGSGRHQTVCEEAFMGIRTGGVNIHLIKATTTSATPAPTTTVSSPQKTTIPADKEAAFYGGTSDQLIAKIRAHADKMNTLAHSQHLLLPQKYQGGGSRKTVDDYAEWFVQGHKGPGGEAIRSHEDHRKEGCTVPTLYTVAFQPNNKPKTTTSLRPDYHVVCASNAGIIVDKALYKQAKYLAQKAQSASIGIPSAKLIQKFVTPDLRRKFASNALRRIVEYSSHTYLALDAGTDAIPSQLPEPNLPSRLFESRGTFNKVFGHGMYYLLDFIGGIGSGSGAAPSPHQAEEEGTAEVDPYTVTILREDDPPVEVIGNNTEAIIKAGDASPYNNGYLNAAVRIDNHLGTPTPHDQRLHCLGSSDDDDTNNNNKDGGGGSALIERKGQARSMLPAICSQVEDPSKGITFQAAMKYGTKTGVYKGSIQVGEGSNPQHRHVVAVKHFSIAQYAQFTGFSSFMATGVRHPQILTPEAVCYDPPTHSVFQTQPFIAQSRNLKQFMTSLKADKSLHTTLTWPRRIEIAMQIACIYKFLHNDHPNGVYTFDDNHPEQYLIDRPKGTKGPAFHVTLVDIDTLQLSVRKGNISSGGGGVSLSEYKTKCRCFYCKGRSNCVFINTVEGYAACGQRADLPRTGDSELESKPHQVPKSPPGEDGIVRDCDATSDVWFQAQLFLYLVKGDLPFGSESMMEVIHQLEKGRYPAANSGDADYDALVKDMFAKRIDEAAHIIPRLKALCAKHECLIDTCPAYASTLPGKAYNDVMQIVS